LSRCCTGTRSDSNVHISYFLGKSIRDRAFPFHNDIIADHLTVADEEPQRQWGRPASPYRTQFGIAANLHRFRSEIDRDCLASVAHLQPCTAESRFHNRDHQSNEEPNGEPADQSSHDLVRQWGDNNVAQSACCSTNRAAGQSVKPLQVRDEQR
jgi:hypothetical protein